MSISVGQLKMSISSSSCLLPARKHSDKKRLRLHLRVFAPKDLSQTTRVLSHHYFAFAHSLPVNDCVFTTLLIRRRGCLSTFDACGRCPVAQQGSRIRLSEKLRYPSDDIESCFEQLGAFTSLCSTYQLIYYHPAAEGLLHHVADTSGSALSAVLKKIDEQQVDVQSCSMLTAFFTATLRLHQIQLPDAAVHGGEARLNSAGSIVATTSIGAANKLLLQKRQNQLATIFQHCAGICIAAVLLTHLNECLDGMWQAAAYVQKSAVEEQVQWLMGAPAGLKLHLGLSQFLGSMGKLWLSYSTSAYRFIDRPVAASLVGMLAAAGVTDGLTVQLALVCNLLHILALPMLFAYVLYTKLYGLQLHCTLLMWRLMRGNRDALAVLRRQYGLEASPRKKNHDLKAQNAPALEQIIVGVLLFTPLVFLLPTTAVYYMLALLLHSAVLVTCWGLVILCQLCQTIPLHTLWCWAVKPGMLPGTLMFVSRPDLQNFFMTQSTSDRLTVLEMVNQPSRLGVHIVQWLTDAYSSTSKCLSISNMLQDVIMGRLVGCEACNLHVRRFFGQHR